MDKDQPFSTWSVEAAPGGREACPQLCKGHLKTKSRRSVEFSDVIFSFNRILGLPLIPMGFRINKKIIKYTGNTHFTSFYFKHC